jgi:site-specific recombinase XerD
MLKYPYDREFIKAAKTFGANWNPDLRAWYVPVNTPIHDLKKHFEPRFSIDCSNLPLAFRVGEDLSERHIELIDKFTVYLRGSRYSPSTIKTYRNWVIEFLFFHRRKLSGQFEIEDVHRFNHNVILARGYSVSSQRQFIGALKLFFTHACKEGPDPEALERPRKDNRLPEVLNKQEIVRILSATKNLKHRTLLSLLYSCGLRVGELIGLVPADLDFERMLVRVRMSKGRKDRYVRVGGAAHVLLQRYLGRYHPVQFLFEGPGGGRYSPSSIRKILRRSCGVAGITKRVTPHTLRHSYATHMLELGVDIRYIQAMLGHRRPETTMIYTHISTHKIQNLPNPLDELVREQLESLPDKGNSDPPKFPLIPGKLWGY